MSETGLPLGKADRLGAEDQTKQVDTFGDLSPWAEPAWSNTLSSPYYNESHRRVRDWARAYIDEKVLPNEAEWEEKGDAPLEVRLFQTLQGPG